MCATVQTALEDRLAKVKIGGRLYRQGSITVFRYFAQLFFELFGQKLKVGAPEP